MIKYLEPLEKSSRCRKWKLVAGEDKAHRRSRRFDGSKREALKALDAFTEEVHEGKVVERSTETFGDYADQWLARLKRSGSVDKQTSNAYQWKISALSFALGDVKLQALTPRKLDDAYAAMLAGKSKSGKPLSGTYVRDCHIVARKMLAQAVKDGLIGRNPADKAAPPKRDTTEKSALSDMEMRLLLAMLPTYQPCAVAVALAVSCGLRRGEVCALRWEDVDLQNGVLEVARAARTDGTVKETKTKAGKRAIPLPDAAISTLLEWRLERPGSEWVICDQDGNALHPNTVTHWWEKHRAEYGCDGVTLHELRHTYITSLARAGVHPKVMQELAGHSSVDVSMSVYTHLSLEEKRAAVHSLGL